MNVLVRGLVLFGLSLLATSVFAQSEPDAAILKVNGQEVFQSDLELVKSMLPLERYKTTKARTNLIEGIYLEFLIQKTVLEQKGMQKVTPKLIEDFLAQPASIDLYGKTRSKDYTPQGIASRRLLERAYMNASQSAWFEEYTRAVFNTHTDVKAALERQITFSYLDPNTVPEVKLRAMLLRDEKTAKRLEKQIRSDFDFERLARLYSLVRASVGGSYPGTERPESTKLNYLEPELQVAISTFAKKGMFRVNAPFGRMWLVNLLDISKLQSNLINTTPVTAEQLSFGGVTQKLSGSYLGDGSQLNGLSGLKTSVEVLDPNLHRYNPVAVRIDKLESGISSIYASVLFSNDSGIFEEIESKINQEIQAWLSQQVVRIGLPHGGAGSVDGLESYLAARVKVSENQLKSYYFANRKRFVFESGGEQIPCRFETLTFANQMRKFFVLFPDDKWFYSLEYPSGIYCDTDGGREPPPLPKKLSRSSLTPIPGGFVTEVFKYEKEFWFIALYGYQPKPLLKPFALVRNEVEQEYRGLVAKKQLPAFEQALRKRVKAQNLLKQAMQELENAGK
jgi:hypothetical protein